MIGGVYVLTAILAIFIYSSRLYTNRSVLAGVGKAYIPIEKGELSRKVRKMVIGQLERSALIAWEARPRDVNGEIMLAEREGLLPVMDDVSEDLWTVGRVLSVDPVKPPWGTVEHAGWTAPAYSVNGSISNLQFDTVITELPNLIEARAVNLAPLIFDEHGNEITDPAVVEVLKRQPKMGLREYLTQLSYLGLVNPAAVGQDFLLRYEKARFGRLPVTETKFQDLMTTFAVLLEGMTELSPVIVDEIRLQTSRIQGVPESISDSDSLATSESQGSVLHYATPEPPRSASSVDSPVTARTGWSRVHASYQEIEPGTSSETLGSVVVRPTLTNHGSNVTYLSDAGSVLHHDVG